MTATVEKLPYYNFDKVLSYNAVYNFVLGARGTGKTYGAKKKAIAAAINKGDQFIYLRRFSTEISDVRQTFFDDVKDEFPDWDLEVVGQTMRFSPAELRGEKKREWRTLGFFQALTKAQNTKSKPFPAVKTIIFDEFILEKGAMHYLPDEAKVFNNFYSTVDRWKDKTRVLFLANSVSIMNPYFIEYNIKPEKGKEFLRAYDGFMVVHIMDSELFGKAVYKTRFGRFVASSDYAEYAIGNQFLDNNDRLLQFKDEKATYYYTLETRQGTFSVWYNAYSNHYYAQERLPKEQIFYTLEPALMDEGKILMLQNDRQMQSLRSSFKLGRMFFDTAQTRNAIIEVFRKR